MDLHIAEIIEEPVDPIDIACVSLRECLRQLSHVNARDPVRSDVVKHAIDSVRYLRSEGGGTFTPSELNRVEIGLDLLELL